MAGNDPLSYRLKNDVKSFLFQKVFIPLYKRAAAKNLNHKKVVFIDDKCEEIPDSMRFIWKHLEEYYDYELVFLSLKHTSQSGESYLLNCMKMVKEIGDASYIFLNDASEIISMLPLRPQTKVIQLWHACGAFKKWGRGTSSLKSGRSLAYHDTFPGYGNLDTVTISSPSLTWAYSDAMGIDEDAEIIQALGVSRTDAYFDTMHLMHAAAHIRRLIPEAAKKKILLYAPTFRGSVTHATSPTFLDYVYLKEHMSEEYVIVIKHHPFVKSAPPLPEELRDFVIEAPKSATIDELMIAADICITDYSSLVFEYALLKKPLLFFVPDRDEYADWRGFYYTIDDFDCFDSCSTTKQVLDWIQKVSSSFDPSSVQPFIDRFMSSCDGDATRRIVRHVFSRDADVYKKPEYVPALACKNQREKDISLIIPAYNVEATLGYCLESVLMQTYSLNRMEIIVVDDCSTDATYDIACAYAEQFPQTIKVMRTDEPTGSPSIPRNKALSCAEGAYVFFIDGDDWISPQAVYKMLEHAVRWQSDVLVVKIRGVGGRKVAQSMFGKNVPKVDIYNSNLMWTFGPWKLFKTALVKDLHFPQCMPEDISFVLRAYVKAHTVSIASDYDYYHVNYRGHEDAHLSYTTWDKTEENIKAYEDIFGFIQENVPPQKRNHTLMRRILQYVAQSLMCLGRRNDPRDEENYRKLVKLYEPFYRGQSIHISSEAKRLLLDAAIHLDYTQFCSLVTLYETGNSGSCEGLTYYLSDGKAYVDYGFEEHFALDVTSALMLLSEYREVKRLEDDTILVSGVLHASPLFYYLKSSFEYTLRLVQKSFPGVYEIPLMLEWLDYDKDLYNEAPLKAQWVASLDANSYPQSWKHYNDAALMHCLTDSFTAYVLATHPDISFESRAVLERGGIHNHAKRTFSNKMYAVRRIMTHKANKHTYRFFF